MIIRRAMSTIDACAPTPITAPFVSPMASGVALSAASLTTASPSTSANSLLALAAARSESLWTDVAPWLIALVGFAVVGCLVLMALRRMLQRDDVATEPFPLEELRRLHRAGQLTDEEFKRAKDRMLGSARAIAAKERAARAKSEAGRRGAGGRGARDGGSDSPDQNAPGA